MSFWPIIIRIIKIISLARFKPIITSKIALNQKNIKIRLKKMSIMAASMLAAISALPPIISPIPPLPPLTLALALFKPVLAVMAVIIEIKIVPEKLILVLLASSMPILVVLIQQQHFLIYSYY